MAETLFVGLLALSLLVAGLLMLWQPRWQRAGPAPRRGRWLDPVAGGALGFLAGIVGIGGGIFLAPLLYLLRWGSERAIAGTCAVFILVNSTAGWPGSWPRTMPDSRPRWPIMRCCSRRYSPAG